MTRDFLKIGYDSVNSNFSIGRLDTKYSKLRNQQNDHDNKDQESQNDTEINENDEFDAYSYSKRNLTKFNDKDYPEDFKLIIKVNSFLNF